MVPDKIGRYEIVRELGRGAMGVVYEARDPNIGRSVALKTIGIASIGTDPEEVARRFKNEARAAGSLNHPNIMTVYDAGEHDGVLYMAMELNDGPTLQAVLAQERTLAPERVVDIIRQVCTGLDFAHSKGIIHRDIKPGNVMLASHGLVKITDFGIARAGEAMTITGQVLGTPNYMSPEQVLGRALDGRSDLFSVGVMLYEMVTGERPFEGQSITTIMYKIVHENPIPPRQLDSTIHHGLSAVVEKALAKAPGARYQSGAELAQALAEYRTAPYPVTGEAQPQEAAPAQGLAVPATSTTPGPRRWLLNAGVTLLSLIVIAGVFISRKHPWTTGRPAAPSATSDSAAPPVPATPPGAPETPREAPAAVPPRVIERQPPRSGDATALLKLNSTPPTAEIFLDGKSTGKKTPANLNIPKGQHSVSVRMRGFQDAAATFRVRGGEELEFAPTLAVAMPAVPAIPNIQIPNVDLSNLEKMKADLQQQGQAQAQAWEEFNRMRETGTPSLVVTTRPPGARILLDGKDTGKTSPAVISVGPGNYRIRVEKAGFEAVEQDATVAERRPGVVNIRMQPSLPAVPKP